MRLFLDGSALFTAALNPGGKAVLVIELGRRGKWEAVTDALAVAEARHNISVKFPEFLQRIDALIGAVTVVPTRVEKSQRPDVCGRRALMFKRARGAGALYLLTADKERIEDSAPGGEPGEGPTVQTVSEFLAARLTAG